MFRVLIIILLFGLITVSCKKEKQSNATVLKNCTGNYLTIKGNDYLVCNSSILDDYESGCRIYVKYSKKAENECDWNRFVCLMVFEHKGVIEIKSIQ